MLHFTNIDADQTVAGNQNFTFIGASAFTAPGQINWTVDGTNTFIQLNTNADLTVDAVIQLNGLINGDLFKRIVALSPGFVVVGTAHGQPRFFVAHGTKDEVLPIDRCSRRIVPALQKAKYDVTYREFEGGHDMPAATVVEAMKWMTAK